MGFGGEVVRRRSLGGAGALNGCNRAKSPVTGRLQIPLVYFAPAAGIFYPIKTVYPSRRYLIPRRGTPQKLLWRFTIDVMPSRKETDPVKSTCYACLPLEGKGDRLRWMRWRGGYKILRCAIYLRRKNDNIHVIRRRDYLQEI